MKPLLSGFPQVIHEVRCASREVPSGNIDWDYSSNSYSRKLLLGWKVASFLLLRGNKKEGKKVPVGNFIFCPDQDLCTNCLCCAAAEIFNIIYPLPFFEKRNILILKNLFFAFQLVNVPKPAQIQGKAIVKRVLCTKLSTDFVDRIKMAYETDA